MAYYLDLFGPETYEVFKASDQKITGFRIRQHKKAQKIKPGDKFICYMTKLSRWIGVLEVESECFIDETPLFYEEDDPFVVRFKVKTLAWLEKEKSIPIREEIVWDSLSFTRDLEKSGSRWTGKFRSSLNQYDDADGKFLEDLIISQTDKDTIYPVDEKQYRKYLTPKVRRENRLVPVSVPEDRDEDQIEVVKESTVRESIKIQALIAQIGERMGFNIWIPNNDRTRVMQEWKPDGDTLLEKLPLNYDEATIRTIEQIDVLWLKKRAIVRAFEVEHTTAVYSGILRMADLLALQPNMDIRLHIVAPYERRDKVFQELQRPVFSLLDRGPLSEICTYISYDSLHELAELKYIAHVSDSVLAEYEEIVE